MANLFANACKTVESYSFNKKTNRVIDNISDTAAANSALRKIKAEEEASLLESELFKDDIRKYQNELAEGVVRRYVAESQIPNNINRIYNIAKEAVLKDILFETFYNSLLMDKSFLEENVHFIKHLTDKYVDDNGGFKVLDNAIKDNMDNMLLKKIKAVCESVAKDISARKLSDSKECKHADLIDFDMNEEEKEKLDYSKKEDLNIDRISELVKNKVLTVVKDEKERHEMDSELIKNIEDDLKDNAEITDDKSLNEAMSKIILNKSVVEESTLFDSLFRDSYQEYILENVAITSTDKNNIDHDKDVSRNYDTEMDIDDALKNEEPVENKEINMDLILTEAITKYTLMETLYTLKLENYSHENIKKLTERILNPVSENVTVVENADFGKNRSEFFKIFNKLKDEPNSDTARDKFTTFINKNCKDKESKDNCKGFIAIAKKQIDDIIEKNPKMKETYDNLSTFMSDTFEGR